MKKLFFYSNIDHDDNAIGITKKVKSQIKAFHELGYDVCYSCYRGEHFVILTADEQLVAESRNIFANTKFNHALRRFGLMQFVTQWMKGLNLDAAYLRYHYFDLYALNLLKAAKRAGAKTVMEMHSYPCLGGKRLQDKVFRKLEKVYGERCVREIDLFAGMREEPLPFDRPQVEIRNTLEPDAIQIRHPIPHGDIIRILSVAYERPAHGFDRLIRGIGQYYNQGGQEEIEVIFAGKYSDTTRQLVREFGLEDHCRFIPPVSGRELDALYDESDIAVGHLANHRVGSFTGSAIKTQEFLAKGIPFIYAWKESMLKDDYPYALKLDLSEEPLNLTQIIAWWKGLGSAEETAHRMRDFFDRSAGWVSQMQIITDWLEA